MCNNGQKYSKDKIFHTFFAFINCQIILFYC